MSLKPVKRLEMILDGQDIEPVTRLEYFLKKAAEGGGGGGGLVEIKNVAPYQVPDRTTGGTKLFNPATDSLFVMTGEGSNYTIPQNPIIVCNDVPPCLFAPTNAVFISVSWHLWDETFERDFIDAPEFCIVGGANIIECQFAQGSILLVKPADIEYRYTAMK